MRIKARIDEGIEKASSVMLRVFLGTVFAALSGCSDKSPDRNGPLGQTRISVAALTQADIAEVCYDLRIRNQSGVTVWQRGTPGQSPSTKHPLDGDTVCSGRFGNRGGGAVTYVAPCDASPVDDDGDGVSDDPNTNVLTVWVDGLYSADGVDIGGWSDPCPDGCQLQVDCRANADVEVALNLTILRQANQGFFDIAVNFEDIFCSAKVDCLDQLLHRPGGARGPTVVVAFACTSGEGEPTWLQMTDLAVVCDSGHTWLDPRVGPGQVGAQSETVWQLATYRGKEGFSAVDKCYWNLAFGLDHGPEGDARDCRLVGQATASKASFGAQQMTPPGTIYPYVDFDVTLTDGDARFVCGANPLNGPDSEVTTRYTTVAGKRFPAEWQCGGPSPVPTGRILCDAQSGPVPGSFTETSAGVSFSHGTATSPLYQLPAGARIKSCCGNPCPGCQP